MFGYNVRAMLRTGESERAFTSRVSATPWGACSSSAAEPTTTPVAEHDTGLIACSKKTQLRAAARCGRSELTPLGALERFLLVVAFALYVGAIALDVTERLYVDPLEAELQSWIAR